MKQLKDRNVDNICSLAKISDFSSVPKSLVRNILRFNLGLKCYKPTFVQELKEEDKQTRLDFANYFLENLQGINNTILWTDEAHFHLSGEVSSINGYIWSDVNPKCRKQKPLHSQKLTVWFGFSGTITCPIFFYPYGKTIKKENYLSMLQTHVIPSLKRHRQFSKAILMQGGAPSHTSKMVKEFLLQQFSSKLIGKGFDCQWPPRSPDLTPCDFFFWGYLKRKVYRHHITDLEHLKEIITDEISKIPMDLYKKVINSIPNRMEKLLKSERAHR